MLTMPIAGALADKIADRTHRAVRRSLVITVGMFGLTQVDADTSYALLIGRAVRDGSRHGRAR